jgi:hypothetical protein
VDIGDEHRVVEHDEIGGGPRLRGRSPLTFIGKFHRRYGPRAVVAADYYSKPMQVVELNISGRSKFSV